MGRMLETLRQARRNVSPAGAETAVVATVSEAGADTETDESIPFIEVGGPRKLVTGSPDVLAISVPKPPAAPASAPSKELVALAAQPAAAEAKRAPTPSREVGPAAPVPDSWTVQFRPMRCEPAVPLPSIRRMAPELIAFHQPEQNPAQQYRSLLAGLLAHCPAGWGQVMLFTSPAPWGGTTTVMLNLAIAAAAQDGKRVAAIDANFRRPALADRLGLAATPGLRDVLSGSVRLPEALQETAQKNLSALPAGRAAHNPDAQVSLDWLMPTLRQLRQQFDLVFVDAASWNEGSEVGALAATCDAVYMVMHQAAGVAVQTNPAVPLLRQPPSNLLGCILTVR